MLIDIESELRRLSLWDDQPPSEQALASTQPFAVDTLSLPQWLQFIFLPTIYYLIDQEQPLPDKCGIAPMAEEYFRGSKLGVDPLLTALERVDCLLSAEAPDYTLPSGKGDSV